MGQNILLAGRLICCHGLCINPFSREVHLHNKQVDLTPREFDLLLWFARHPGEVFSRLSLLDNVWGISMKDMSIQSTRISTVFVPKLNRMQQSQR